MAVSQEEQDKEYKDIGFMLDKDYETPDFSTYDETLLRLSDLAEATEPKDTFLERLAKAKFLYDIVGVYHYDSSGFKLFAKQQEKRGKLDISADELFKLLDKYWEYESKVRFIITDGGEIREGQAFEKDGVTIKKGFTRLYWK